MYNVQCTMYILIYLNVSIYSLYPNLYTCTYLSLPQIIDEALKEEVVIPDDEEEEEEEIQETKIGNTILHTCTCT